MTQLARAAAVFLFVGMSAFLLFLGGVPRRRAINALIGYVLILLIIMTISGRDAWPLATFPMMANDRSTSGRVETMIAVRAITADGSEWEVDPQAWSPLTNQSIRGWFENVFDRTDPAQRKEVGRFLLQKAEWARQAREAGDRFGNERFLGTFSAPDTYSYQRVAVVSRQPYVGIRVYRLQWVAAAPPAAPRRQLLLEFTQ